MWFVSRKIITIEIHSIVLYIKSTIKQSIHNYRGGQYTDYLVISQYEYGTD